MKGNTDSNNEKGGEIDDVEIEIVDGNNEEGGEINNEERGNNEQLASISTTRNYNLHHRKPLNYNISPPQKKRSYP